jgi:DNA-binding transcriptional LysR family regulator
MRLIESGNAVALMPDLVWIGRGTTAQLLDLPGNPHRTVFTSVRRSSAQRPAILAARETLAATAASVTQNDDGGPAVEGA